MLEYTLKFVDFCLDNGEYLRVTIMKQFTFEVWINSELAGEMTVDAEREEIARAMVTTLLHERIHGSIPVSEDSPTELILLENRK